MKHKILVVDDEEDISRLIKLNLQKEGFEVITLNNSVKTVELAKKEKPGIITLDIMMPGMDGFQVLKALKEDPETKNIPVIMISVVGEANKDEGLRLGATAYLNKPIDFSRLFKMIADVNIRPEENAAAKKKILIVDDEIDTANLIKRTLAASGFDTRTINDGEEALSLIARERPDLIILDLYMPKMDGFAVMKKLKSDKATADIPIIVLTSHDTKSHREKSLFLGARGFMTKPFSVESLSEQISEYLKRISVQG
jgi:adenylate cyclase